jgi:hypothetical protein
MSGEIVFDLIVKIIFWVSLAGFIFMVLSKTAQVKAVVVAESSPSAGLNILTWPQRVRDVSKDISRAAPQMAKEIVVKNKQLVTKKIEALKFFSNQRIIYQFKKKKLTDLNFQSSKNKTADEKHEFNHDYWDKIKKQ